MQKNNVKRVNLWYRLLQAVEYNWSTHICSLSLCKYKFIQIGLICLFNFQEHGYKILNIAFTEKSLIIIKFNGMTQLAVAQTYADIGCYCEHLI